MKKIVVIVFSLLFISVSSHAQEEGRTARKLELMLTIPYVNNFYSHPQGESGKSGIGFFGLSAGVGYQLRAHRYLSLIGSIQLQLELPFPVGIDYDSGTFEDQHAMNVALMDNFERKRWMFGYGVMFARNTWRVRHLGLDYDPLVRGSYSVSSYAMGVPVSVHYRVFRPFLVGIVYRPSILTIGPTTRLKYAHSLSLDFAFRWRMRLPATMPDR